MPFLDCHCHTERSDCSEDVSLERYAELAPVCGFSFAITDHSAHLFYPPDNKWAFWTDAAEALFEEHYQAGLARCARYVTDVRAVQTGGMLLGVELDVLPDGRMVFDPDLLDGLDLVLGAVHGIRALRQDRPLEEVVDEFKSRTLRLCELRVDALAHPFREWKSAKRAVPPGLMEWTVEAARDAGMALELNCHYQVPECDRPMIRLCAELGVPIAIGTDSHRSHEFGDFSYHRRLLAEEGLGDGEGLAMSVEACRREKGRNLFPSVVHSPETSPNGACLCKRTPL